jgi:uroporphyrinogen-III synthase|tara:strand:- start:5108 stop:5827 length:720 start_codon:yes stop_codon:yes gene_type:complete
LNKINIIITGEDYDYGFNELKAMDVNIFHYPMIYTLGVDINIHPNIYNYIIFTSKNGVKYFLKNVSISINSNVKFICIGKKTAEVLKSNNLNPDILVRRNYSKFMCNEIKNMGISKNNKLLLIQGNLAKKELFECLSKSFEIDHKIVYTTNPVKEKIDELNKKIDNENSYVVFTSPSTFNSFIDKYNLKNNIISIGNTTTDHIRDRGFEPLMTAKMQSYEGISNSIIDYLNKKLNHEIS